MARPAVITVADTIAKSFLLAVETRGDKTAIREKNLGVWQSTSWREWLRTAKEIAYALHAVGFIFFLRQFLKFIGIPQFRIKKDNPPVEHVRVFPA